MSNLYFILAPAQTLPSLIKKFLIELNVNYSKQIWEKCVAYQIPLVYASSAATYGLGENGYDDNESTISQLKPLNPYGDSKNEFDIWALQQEKKPFFWAGTEIFQRLWSQ